MSFRLVPKSVTLNGVMAVILRYFSEFVYLPGVLRKSSRSLSHLLMSSCVFGPIANLDGHYFQPSFVCLCISDRHFYPSRLTDFDR